MIIHSYAIYKKDQRGRISSAKLRLRLLDYNKKKFYVDLQQFLKDYLSQCQDMGFHSPVFLSYGHLKWHIDIFNRVGRGFTSSCGKIVKEKLNGYKIVVNTLEIQRLQTLSFNII